TVLQHVGPPRIFLADPHVIGNDVEDVPHPLFAQRGREGGVTGLVADLGIERAMIDDVVAVLAAGPCLQVGRGVAVRDPEIVQVRHQRSGIAEAELAVQLESIRRLGTWALRGRLGSMVEQAVDQVARHDVTPKAETRETTGSSSWPSSA